MVNVLTVDELYAMRETDGSESSEEYSSKEELGKSKWVSQSDYDALNDCFEARTKQAKNLLNEVSVLRVELEDAKKALENDRKDWQVQFDTAEKLREENKKFLEIVEALRKKRDALEKENEKLKAKLTTSKDSESTLDDELKYCDG